MMIRMMAEKTHHGGTEKRRGFVDRVDGVDMVHRVMTMSVDDVLLNLQLYVLRFGPFVSPLQGWGIPRSIPGALPQAKLFQAVGLFFPVRLLEFRALYSTMWSLSGSVSLIGFLKFNNQLQHSINCPNSLYYKHLFIANMVMKKPLNNNSLCRNSILSTEYTEEHGMDMVDGVDIVDRVMTMWCIDDVLLNLRLFVLGFSWHPFRVGSFSSIPRAALRLPWAITFQAFSLISRQDCTAVKHCRHARSLAAVTVMINALKGKNPSRNSVLSTEYTEEHGNVPWVSVCSVDNSIGSNQPETSWIVPKDAPVPKQTGEDVAC